MLSKYTREGWLITIQIIDQRSDEVNLRGNYDPIASHDLELEK